MKLLSKIFIGLGLAMVLTASCVSISNSTEATGQILLTPKNTVTIRTGITDESVQKAQLEIKSLNALRGNENYPIYLVLDSPGGSIYYGEQLIEFLKGYKNIQTITIFAASMGAIIVQSNPGKRYITNNGIMMFHRASGRFEGQFEEGELESQLNFWKAMIREMELTVSKRMGLSLEEYKRYAKDEWWIKGNAAVKQNVADESVVVTCSDELIDATENIKVPILGDIAVDFTFSQCPLLRNPLN